MTDTNDRYRAMVNAKRAKLRVEDLPSVIKKALAMLTNEWQDTTTLKKLLDSGSSVAQHLRRLEVDGLAECRGRGVIGDPFEWRLKQPAEAQGAAPIQTEQTSYGPESE